MSEGGKQAIRADEEVVPASEQSGEFKELDERTRHVVASSSARFFN